MSDKTVRPCIPVDDATSEDIPEGAWDEDGSPARFYAMLDDMPEAKAAFDNLSQELEIEQSTLAQVRRARSLTQQALAVNLGLDQSAISHLEHRADILLSTLRLFIEATGGSLHLVATYPDAPPVSLQIGSQHTAAGSEDLATAQTEN